MSSASLVPCLVQLRTEFNQLFPDRDKSSDGWIGDAAHSSRDSDHNPAPDGQVHAIDVDRDLAPGVDMLDYVNHVIARCRTGLENRLTYVIYNRHIWSASNGWRRSDYNGSNPHDKHAHFSASYTPSREANKRSWALEEVPVALTADDKKWITGEFTRVAKAVVKEELAAYGRGDGDTTGRVYSRDGLATTVEQDTKKIREALDEIKSVLTKPAGK